MPARLTDRPLAFVSNERNDLGNGFLAGKFSFGLGEPCRHVAVAEKNHPVGATHGANRIESETPPFHSQHVDAAEAREGAARQTEGDHVAAQAARPRAHRMAADARELMHASYAADEDEVSDDAMAAQRGAICKHDVVSDDAVMRNVAVGHEEPIVADFGDATAVFAAGVHRDA